MNVIGRYKSIDGQKQKPENGCFTGFLASPARFERAAPRLGEFGFGYIKNPII